MVYDAIDLVLLAFREPLRLAEMRECSLPDGVGQIIHLAAGESAILQSIIERTGESEEVLKEASVFFLQQVLFAPGTDSYRTLGVSPDADQDEIRDHYRWLMKWLHPDRNQDAWEAVHADRVNVAWQDLKTPERRANYDRQTDSAHVQLAMVPAGAPLRARPAVPRPGHGPLLSGSMVRKLPTIILGTLGVSAAVIFGLMYWAQKTTERELSERRAAATAVVAVPDTAAEPSVAVGPAPVAVVAPEVTTPVAVAPSPAPAPVDAEPEKAVPVLVANDPPAETLPAPVAVQPELDTREVATAVQAVVVDTTPTSDRGIAHSVSAAGTTQPQIAERASVPEPPIAMTSAPVVNRHQPAQAPTVVSAAVTPVPVPAATVQVVRHVSATTTQATAPPASLVVATAEPAPRVESVPVVATAPTPPAVAGERSSSAQPVDPPTDAASAPSVALSEALVREFASAYASGNIRQFDQLFASGSTPSDLQDMRLRMRSAEMRYLEFGSIFWDEQQGQARALAKFRDTFVPRGEKRATTETGLLELRLAWIAGEVRIADADRD